MVLIAGIGKLRSTFTAGAPRTFASCATRPTGLGQTELGPTAPQEQSVWSRRKCSRITTRFGSIKFETEASRHPHRDVTSPVPSFGRAVSVLRGNLSPMTKRNPRQGTSRFLVLANGEDGRFAAVRRTVKRPILLNRRTAPANFGTNKCRLFCDWAAWSGPSGDTANAIKHRHSERPASSGRA